MVGEIQKLTRSLVCSCLCVVAEKQQPSYAYQMVRTDAKEQKLDAFVIPKSLQETAAEETCSVAMETQEETAGGDAEVEVLRVEGGQTGSEHGGCSKKERSSCVCLFASY